jgi:hypothetical protein
MPELFFGVSTPLYFGFSEDGASVPKHVETIFCDS